MKAFAHLLELSSADLGGVVHWSSDDFFAEASNLLKPGPAVFDPDAYTDRGKEMDGWESRRRRVRGHDVAVIELGVPGVLEGVDIDTSHFLGNHPPFASIDVAWAPGVGANAMDTVEWTEVLGQVPLERGCSNLFGLPRVRATHVRLHMVPAGGIARLRVYGSPRKELRGGDDPIDLAGLLNGGRALGCTDMFFSPMSNLLRPQGPENMGGGWETRRSRPPGKDFVILELGHIGALEHIEIATTHFKGNYPSTVAVDGVLWPGAEPWALMNTDAWRPVVEAAPLGANRRHFFRQLAETGPLSHLRMRIEPDGGVARFRAWGWPREAVGFELDVTGICGSTAWTEAMSGRTWSSREHVLGEAERQWWRLRPADQLEAFAAHPHIGGDVGVLREKYQARAASEQAGVDSASEELLHLLATANVEYENRYGFLFLVCASGKTAQQMFDILQHRMENGERLEFQVACGEEAKIMRLRLESALEGIA